MIHSFPKVWNLGHPAVRDLFDGPVVVQEKVDGSQFSFRHDGLTGDLEMRSKGAQIYPETADKLFAGAVLTAQALCQGAGLITGAVYRCEAMMGPRHNTMKYDRAPRGNLVLFDVETSPNEFLDHVALEIEAARLGLEVVPNFSYGDAVDIVLLQNLLETESFLGGATVEGIVVKNYARFGIDGKVLMGKHVSEKFKETHGTAWKAANPGGKDIIQNLGAIYKTDARWEKAVQHLRDAGELTGEPKDIGGLIREVQRDVQEECADEIKEKLFAWGWPKVSRIVTGGLAEWYKARLMNAQFEPEVGDFSEAAAEDAWMPGITLVKSTERMPVDDVELGGEG